MGPSDLEISADLSEALGRVLGEVPTKPEPTVVVAACLEALAKGYGLSESLQIDHDPLERADLPAPAKAVLEHFFASGGSGTDAGAVRDRLYDLLAELAEDRDARKQLNSNRPFTEIELLTVGQVYWNLEGTPGRDRLPIRPGPITVVDATGSRQAKADIPVPGANKDFATMKWTARVNQKSRSKSSGQSFRKQGARLTVLAAQVLVRNAARPLPDLDGAVLRPAPPGRGSQRTLLISWPGDEPDIATPLVTPQGTDESRNGVPLMVPHAPGNAQHARSDAVRVLVGAPAEVGADYQWRGCDVEIEELWARGGDRRIWLRGGPGLGKSYAARRLMQEAVADTGADREDLLVWVASADADAVTEALSTAVDRLRQQGFAVPGDAQDSSERKARSLLGLLAVSPWRWLIVLDNVDARSVIEAGLVPPGGNPNGRVLLTTLSQDPRIASHGHVVAAHLFTPDEAEAYLRSDVHFAGRAPGPLSRAPAAQSRQLAQTVGHHPLALSIAASTISANAMTLPDWIDEFTAAETMDAAADEPDRGGYPHLLGASWQVALARASQGLPQGVVQRAAIVAALQDPDGHPTWLWDRDAVAKWVAGGVALARHHQVPVALRRLADSGLIELRGTWRGGQVAIHQLAARAVREGTVATELTDIAVILLEQWLLELTVNPPAAQPVTLRRNLRPIAALPDLPAPARRTVTALLAYAQPTQASVDRSMVRRLEPYLAVGGVTVRIMLGEQWIEIGDMEAALGRTAQARAAYQKASDLYRPLVDDDSLNDDELVSCLIHLGALEDQLSNPELARASRERAILLVERLADAAADIDTLIVHLADLVTLHELLGNHYQKAQVLDRSAELLIAPPDDLASPADTLFALRRSGSWRTLAGVMEQAGRVHLAKQCRIRELAVYERAPDEQTPRKWADAVQALALLHARSGEWTDAERLLTCLTDITLTPWAASTDGLAESAFEEFEDPRLDVWVLLASVRTHLGRREDADGALARAADQSPDPRADGDPHQDKPVDEEQKRTLQELQSRSEKKVDGIFLQVMALDSARRGRLEDAVGLSASRIDLVRQIADDSPGDTDAEADLAATYEFMGGLLFQQEVWDEAATNLARAVGILQMLAVLDPSREDAQRKLGSTLSIQGLAQYHDGDHVAALGTFIRAVGACRRATQAAPDDKELAEQLDAALIFLAMAQKRLGNYDGAVVCYDELINIRRRLVDRAADDQEPATRLADSLEGLAEVHRQDGNYGVAVGCFEESINIRRRLADRAADDQELATRLADSLEGLAAVHLQDGNYGVAVGCFEESINIRGRLAEHSPEDLTAQIALAEAWMQVARIRFVQHRAEDAVEPARRGSDIYAGVVLRMGSEDNAIRTGFTSSRELLGYVLTRSGHWEEGMTHLNEVLSAKRALVEDAPDDLEAQYDLAITMFGLAEIHAESGQQEEAADYLTRSNNILQLLADLDPGGRPGQLIIGLEKLAETLRTLGRTDDADEALARARDLEDRYPDDEGEGGV